MRKLSLLLAALLLLLSGCAPAGYYQARTHYSNRPENPATVTVGGVISSRDALHQAIKNAIDARKGREELTIQGYDGEWEDDLLEIRQELKEVYPYGKYAVESIDSTATQYKVTLTIKYWDSAQSLKDIPYVVSMADFEQRAAKMLGAFTIGPGSEDSTSQAFMFGGFSDSAETMARRLIKCWTQNADSALDLRDMSYRAYPADARDCIIEINVQYMESQSALLQKRDVLRRAARAAANGFTAGGSDGDKVDFVYRWLWEHVQYDFESFSGLPKYSRLTAYGGLVEGYAAQSGYALTAQVLCQTLGLDSQVIVGEKGEQSDYYWLYVMVDDQPMHFDPSAMRGVELERPEVEAEGEDADEMAENYSGHSYLFDVQEGVARFSWDEGLYFLEK